MTITYTTGINIYNVSKSVLENDVISAAAWFDNNYMCANPDKFQSIILSRDGQPSLSISVPDNTIFSDTTIKVLGVTLDNWLTFDKHVSSLCIKASRPLRYFPNTLIKSVVFWFLNLLSHRILVIVPCLGYFALRQTSINWMNLQEIMVRFLFRDTTAPYKIC